MISVMCNAVYYMMFNVTAPVKESPTIYDAFIEKERRAQAKLQAEHNTGQGDHNTPGSKKSQPAKKKGGGSGGAGDRKKEPPMSLEEAVAKVEYKKSCTISRLNYMPKYDYCNKLEESRDEQYFFGTSMTPCPVGLLSKCVCIITAMW